MQPIKAETMNKPLSAIAGATRRIIGYFRCKHEWQEPYYVHGDRAYSQCVRCWKKRVTKWP